MGPDALKIIDLMFNKNEHLCVSDSKYAYSSLEIKIGISQNVPLISFNKDVPVKFVNSSQLTLMALNPMKPNSNRQDSNVSAFRSFLVEMDVGDINTQINTIASYKMPFSAQIFSGNKSVHTIITLSEDLRNNKEYKLIANWILNIITFADKNCANASRSFRIPNAIRPETGKEQKLITMGKRISHKELFDWLNKYKHLQPIIKPKKQIEGKADYSRLSPWARGMLEKGIVFRDGRNKTWFALAVDCAKAGFNEEETIELLSKRFEEESDFREKEWLTSIKSAFKYVLEAK